MKLARYRTPKSLAYWGVCLSAALLCISFKHHLERNIHHPAQSHPSIKPIEARYHSQSLKRYNAGFANFLSALMWVQLLQQSTNQPIQDEHVSWEFTYLDGITELDPHFERAYSFGATFLSVFKQDSLGAKLILEKWVRRRPHYWRANYLLGFHYFHELKDANLGSLYILRAARMDSAPSWISSLGVRVLSETGALAQALKLSLELYPGINDLEGRFRLKRRIRSLNYTLQYKGWESALKKYRAKWQAEPETIRELRPFLQSEVREVSSVFDDKVSEELEEMIREPFAFYYDDISHGIKPSFNAKTLGLDVVGIERAKQKR